MADLERIRAARMGHVDARLMVPRIFSLAGNCETYCVIHSRFCLSLLNYRYIFRNYMTINTSFSYVLGIDFVLSFSFHFLVISFSSSIALKTKNIYCVISLTS